MEVDEDIIGNGLGSEAEDGELLETDDMPNSNSPPYHNIHNAHHPDPNQLLLRAQRFGIKPYHTSIDLQFEPDLARLYKMMGVDGSTRLESLHLFGTDLMRTPDVFQYFHPYPPAGLEWLTPKTCNAVWLEEKLCAMALVTHSDRILGHDLGGDLQENESHVELKDLRISLPPGIWRKGHTRKYAPHLYMRFANRTDRRENSLLPLHPDARQSGNMVFPDQGDEIIKKKHDDTINPWSDIAKQWGNFERREKQQRAVPPPHKPQIRDARELIRKKTVDFDIFDDDVGRDSSDESPRAKPHFGQMKADIEEKNSFKRRNRKRSKKSLFNRSNDLRPLLRRRNLDSHSHFGHRRASSDDEDKLDLRSRLGYGARAAPAATAGDSDMSDDEVDKRRGLGDLREKLSKGGRASKLDDMAPLRIVVRNDTYRSRSRSRSESESSTDSDDSSSSSS